MGAGAALRFLSPSRFVIGKLAGVLRRDGPLSGQPAGHVLNPLLLAILIREGAVATTQTKGLDNEPVIDVIRLVSAVDPALRSGLMWHVDAFHVTPRSSGQSNRWRQLDQRG